MLAGWVAAGGALDRAAWAVFAILFLWQLPHFLALAWIHREDYRRGGFAIVSVRDPDGRRTAGRALFYTIALLPVSLLPTLLGLTGGIYLSAAVLLGLVFLAYALRMVIDRRPLDARRLFLASVAYLPLLFLFMVLDKTRL